MNPVARCDAGDHAAAAEILRRDGVVAIESVLPCSTIERLAGSVFDQHPEFANPALLHDYLGTKERRFVAPVRLTAAIRDSGIATCPAIERICAAMLGEDYVFEAFGILLVRPGAPAQRPHRDGGALFPESGVDRVLPPSAMTIVFPLVDVDALNAPTGAVPGSHRFPPRAKTAAATAIELNRGDAAIWDFRTLHRGLAHNGNEPRPALYFTACRPFWIDHLNFHGNARAKLIGDDAVIADLGPRYVRAVMVG